MKREELQIYGIDRWLWAVAVCAAGLSSAQAAVVSGRLTEPPAHRAVKGATIEIVELHRSVVTGADGGFKFANVAAGEYTLRITVSGKEARSVDKRFAVDDDHDFVANVTLTSAAGLGSADLDAILVTSSRIPLTSRRGRAGLSATRRRFCAVFREWSRRLWYSAESKRRRRRETDIPCLRR